MAQGAGPEAGRGTVGSSEPCMWDRVEGAEVRAGRLGGADRW